MGRGKEQSPTLAVALDATARSALQTVAKAIESSPEEWLGVAGVTFEPETHENFQMAFVLCTDRLCGLPSEELQTLHDDVRRHVNTIAAEGVQSLQCRSLELFGPDRSHLIARFSAPLCLTELRRAAWRTCKDFGVAFPDARWAPHIRLGRIKASRGQLKSLAFGQLRKELAGISIQPSMLTLIGKRPQDSHCHCDWDIALPIAHKPDVRDKVPATLDAEAAARAIPCEDNTSPQVAATMAVATQSDTCSQPTASAPASRPGGFVAELPKFRRPSGDRPGRKGGFMIAPP